MKDTSTNRRSDKSSERSQFVYGALEESWAQWLGTSEKQVFLHSSHSEMTKCSRQKATRDQVLEAGLRQNEKLMPQKKIIICTITLCPNQKIWISRKESRDKNQGVRDHKEKLSIISHSRFSYTSSMGKALCWARQGKRAINKTWFLPSSNLLRNRKNKGDKA